MIDEELMKDIEAMTEEEWEEAKKRIRLMCRIDDDDEIIQVYKRFKHLDSVFDLTDRLNKDRVIDDDSDPFHVASVAMWKAIKSYATRKAGGAID